MPLNPNGKVDKPALPFPDTVAAAATVTPADALASKSMSSTERTIHDIWVRLLPGSPPTLPLDESFFDLGGHSILATRLIFELRKSLAVGAPLGLVFDFPTISALAQQLDSLRNGDLGLSDGQNKSTFTAPADTEYSDDAEVLLKTLQPAYKRPAPSTTPQTVFLTGATGFLGAFILRDLLSRPNEVKKVFCHVRASNPESAVARLRESGEARGAWEESWVTDGRVEAIVGDLTANKLGMSPEDWTRVAEEADIIVHNGAMVRSSFNSCQRNSKF